MLLTAAGTGGMPVAAGTLFAFDLDGTVTTREILPVVAGALGLEESMRRMTALALAGSVPFEQSFRERFSILSAVPLPDVRALVRSIPLEPDIVAFIAANRPRCALITGNADCWIAPIAERLGCRVFCSRTEMGADGRPVLVSIPDKGAAVRAFAEHGERVVAVGESANDIPMFEAADVGIAYGGVHAPAPSLLRAADLVAENGKELCALLRGFL